MQYPKYQALSVSSDYTSYTFISTGTKGDFEIEVQFSFLIQDEDSDIYNLGFGTRNEEDEINDIIVLNNGDRDKILATIAGFVIIFFKQYPAASVFFSGSTPARTRLYRSAITINWKELEKDFEIIGIPEEADQEPESFVSGKDYVAFLVRKIL